MDAGSGKSFLGVNEGVGHAAFAQGINNQGDLAVSIDVSGGGGVYKAAIYRSSNGTFSALSSEPGYATDINAQGVIAGSWSVQANGQWVNRAARFTGSGNWEPLGTLGGVHSAATGIADDGATVGWSYLSTTPPTPDYWDLGHAFLWRPSTGIVDLSTTIDASLGWELVKANDISPDGNVIVGYGFLKGRLIRGFRYRGGQVDNLGAGAGAYISYANGTNNRGDVAGTYYPTGADPGLTHAMAYTDDMGFVDLNHLLPPDSGWLLRQAAAINANRQIVGWGLREGKLRGFRMKLPLPCEAAVVLGPVSNLIQNGSFEGSIDGWSSLFQNSQAPAGTIDVALESGDARGTLGALRVKQGPYMMAPAAGGTNGAYGALVRGVQPYSFFTVSFWGKSVRVDPGTKLAAFFGGVPEHSGPLITLTPEWRHYRVHLYAEHFPFTSLGFGLLRNASTTGEGEFLIDDILVEETPRCQDVAAGEVVKELYCRIDRDVYPTQEVKVSFEARAPWFSGMLATTGWMGRYQAEGLKLLDGNWQRVEFNLPLRQMHEVISLRAVASLASQDALAAVPGIFEVRNFAVEGVAPCEPFDPTNLVAVSTFECGRSGYRSWLHDQAVPGDRSDLIAVQLIEDSATADGTKALKVAVPVFPPHVVTYTHNYGLSVQSREAVSAGDFVRVAFDAKRTDPVGSPYLMLNRAWGRDMGFTTVTLKDEWQHYELTAKHQFATGVYTFVLVGSKTSPPVSAPTPGAFAIDNLRIERLPACNEQLDVTREGLLTCTLPAGLAAGSQVKLTFAAQSLSGAAVLKVTRPWGLDRGGKDVLLTPSLTDHEVSVTVPASNEPITFRLVDASGGQPRQDPAAGRFRISNVRFGASSECNNNAGLTATMANNGGFACDDAWWSLARYDSNTQSYVSGGLSKQLLPAATGRSQALRVTVGAPDAGVESRDGTPAGVRVAVTGFPLGRWVQVEFDARRADPAGSRFLRVFPSSNGQKWVTLGDDWQRHRMSIISRYTAIDELFFFLSKGPSADADADVGSFDIDNIVIRELEQCEDAALGPHEGQYDCAIPNAWWSVQDYRVTYEARALGAPHPFAVTRPEGYGLGSDTFFLGTDWQPVVTHVRFRNVLEPQEGLLSFRSVDRAKSGFITERGGGRFELRNVKFEPATCPQRQASIVLNEDLECGAGYWQPVVFQHGLAAGGYRSDLIDVQHAPGAGHNSQGAVLVTQNPGLQQIENHTHTTGAAFVLREDIQPGDRIRISFNAKLAPGTNVPPFLRLNRMWGGMDERTTAVLSSQWRHFEHTITERHGAGSYHFVLQTTDTQSSIATPVVGAFLLDNVVLERVVDCAADVSEGLACDDGNGCTVDDRCRAGVCGGAAKSCDDGDDCTTDFCEAGVCAHGQAPAGIACCSAVVAGKPLSRTDEALVYAEGSETCGTAMENTSTGREATYVQDETWSRCAPDAGARVISLNNGPVRSSWFSPVAVSAGETYCLSVALRWGSTGKPYVGLVPIDVAGAGGAAIRLIGAEGGVAVQPGPPAWRYYAHSFVAAAGMRAVRVGIGTEPGAGGTDTAPTAADDLQVAKGQCPATASN